MPPPDKAPTTKVCSEPVLAAALAPSPRKAPASALLTSISWPQRVRLALITIPANASRRRGRLARGGGGERRSDPHPGRCLRRGRARRDGRRRRRTRCGGRRRRRRGREQRRRERARREQSDAGAHPPTIFWTIVTMT